MKDHARVVSYWNVRATAIAVTAALRVFARMRKILFSFERRCRRRCQTMTDSVNVMPDRHIWNALPSAMGPVHHDRNLSVPKSRMDGCMHESGYRSHLSASAICLDELLQ